MSVKANIGNLERKMRKLLEEENLYGAGKYIIKEADNALKIASSHFPKKAVRELRFRERCNWPDGSGMYESEDDSRIKHRILERRYGEEHELLQAHHPERVRKLWSGMKTGLEKKYGRAFNDRLDFAVMGAIYKNFSSLEENIEQLQTLQHRRNFYFEAFCSMPRPVELEKFWKEQQEVPALIAVTGSVIDVHLALERPDRLFRTWIDSPDKNGKYHRKWSKIRDLLYPKSFSNGWDAQPFHSESFHYYLNVLMQEQHEKLLFAPAVELAFPHEAKEAGLFEYTRFMHGVPKEIETAAVCALQRGYEHPEADSGARQFMKWMKTKFLERWKATAVDYDSLFHFHNPCIEDIRLMATFYTLRHGKRVTYQDDDVRILRERLPGILERMVQDGKLQRQEIYPLLKREYPMPEELQQGTSTREKEREQRLFERMTEHIPAIETSSRPLLPLRVGEELEVRAPPFAELASVFDAQQRHRLVYDGNHILLIASMYQYPSGEWGMRDVKRIVKIRETARPNEGVCLSIAGSRVLVSELKSYADDKSLKEALFNVDTNIVPARAYTTVVDLSPADFEKSYWRDFLAHAFVHRPHLHIQEFEREFREIKEKNFPVVGMQYALGSTGRVWFQTFEMNSRFGFSLEYNGAIMGADTLAVAKDLLGYLKDVGLRFYQEAHLDESGRAHVKHKLEQRTFYQENFTSIQERLQGNGLVNVLLYALQPENKYNMLNFGPAEKSCDFCHQSYVKGLLFRPDLREQWINGFDAQNLHVIARHPQTFVNEGDLPKIARLVNEARTYQPPFIEQPSIMPVFSHFMEKYLAFIHAREEAYNFWESTCGGICAEEEELAHSPKLRKLAKQEHELNVAKGERMREAAHAALEVQRAYDSLRGAPSQELKTDNVFHFWGNQVMMYSIYWHSDQKLLPQTTGLSEHSFPTGPRLYR